MEEQGAEKHRRKGNIHRMNVGGSIGLFLCRVCTFLSIISLIHMLQTKKDLKCYQISMTVHTSIIPHKKAHGVSFTS